MSGESPSAHGGPGKDPIVYCTLQVGPYPAGAGWATPGQLPGVAVSAVVINPDGSAAVSDGGTMAIGQVLPLAYGQTARDLEAAILAALAEASGADTSGLACVFLPEGL
jgi:hypothetical protein